MANRLAVAGDRMTLATDRGLDARDRRPAEHSRPGDAERAQRDPQPVVNREVDIREEQGLASQFRRGQMVRHPTFGIGRIAEVSNMGQHTRAVVEFNQAGRKTLILQYARLEPVG